MKHFGRAFVALAAASLLVACSSSGDSDGGSGGGGPTCKSEPGGSGLAHVVIVVQENHSFDNYFGRYCTAAPGSNPTCTNGPSCCEAAPAKEPSGAAPVSLDDAQNAVYDPDHSQACEIAEIDGGAMDHFVTGADCSDPKNFAIAPPDAVSTYTGYAAKYALADRYFQSIAGASSTNDMYFAVAKEVFVDNTVKPGTPGSACSLAPTIAKYEGQPTIASLLQDAGKTFHVYAEGYADAVAAGDDCASPPSDCGLHVGIYPCIYDASDIPFLYYAQHADDPDFVQDYSRFEEDLAGGTLPDVSFVKAVGYHSEHPGYKDTISDGMTFVDDLVQAVETSCYKDDTLILVTWDEGGGYFDHVSPPPDSTVDNQPYGTRVPLLAIGRFAKKGAVSHVEMEHSSVVKFLEYVYLGGKTGQLGGRDAVVNNLGSLLDAEAMGMTIPDP
jgi:phospholipase C